MKRKGVKGSQSTTYHFLQVFTSRVGMLTSRMGILATGSKNIDQVEETYTCPMFLQDIKKGLRAFLGRPWFRRMWVRQEILAARELPVQCGLSVIPWHTIKSASKSFKAFSAVLMSHDLHTEGLENFSLRLDALRQASLEGSVGQIPGRQGSLRRQGGLRQQSRSNVRITVFSSGKLIANNTVASTILCTPVCCVEQNAETRRL